MNNTNELEKRVIASLLVADQGADVLAQAYSKLTKEMFTVDTYGTIFAECKRLTENHKPIDDLIVAGNSFVDASVVIDISSSLISSAGLSQWVDAVVDAYRVRELSREFKRAMSSITTDGFDKSSASMCSKIDELRRLVDKTPDSTLADDVKLEMGEICAASVSGSCGMSLKTGLADIDSRTCGFVPGELVIVGGCPSMGKTALVLSMCHNMIGKHKQLIFSMEMTKKQIVRRLLSQATGINLSRFRDVGSFKQVELNELVRLSKNIESQEVRIMQGSGRTVDDIRSIAYTTKSKHGLDVIVVDYLGLMSSKNKNRTRAEEVREFAYGLKNIAIDLEVVVIALSQLNRDSVKLGAFPRLCDLRDSGDVEASADYVLFVHRPQYFNEESTDPPVVILAKARNAEAPAIIPVYWNAATAQYLNADMEGFSR